MTSEQSALARRRLSLGITNVGFWVLSAVAGLGWLVGNPDGRSSNLPLWLAVGLVLAIVSVQAVFDFVGGFVLIPIRHPEPWQFLRRWVRGILAHSLVMSGVGLVGMTSLQRTGGFCVGLVLSTVALALGRGRLHRMIAGTSIQKVTLEGGETLLASPVDDPAFTGGILGFGRRAKSLLPVRWLEALPMAERAAELYRRRWQIARGLPARAFLLVLFWNLLGSYLGTMAFHFADRPPSLALLGHACWMTLWTFLSLLVMPSLSRGAVFAGDRAAADVGADPRSWIRRFPQFTGEDGSPRAAIQSIFYPIPSAQLRLERLAHPQPGFVTGNLARSNLYYSWASFTLLGRAVHCNVGRPSLWVFPPAA
jgi:hypothetical protein